ncbi:hypothetical protein JCM10369A_43520 [Nocardioides pyridinolyticus]
MAVGMRASAQVRARLAKSGQEDSAGEARMLDVQRSQVQILPPLPNSGSDPPVDPSLKAFELDSVIRKTALTDVRAGSLRSDAAETRESKPGEWSPVQPGHDTRPHVSHRHEPLRH